MVSQCCFDYCTSYLAATQPLLRLYHLEDSMSHNQLLASEGYKLSVEVIDPGGYKVSAKYRVTVGCNGQEFTTNYTSGWGNRVWRTLAKTLAKTPRGTQPGFDYWASYRKPGKRVEIRFGPINLRLPEDCAPDRQDQQRVVFDAFARITEPILPTLTDVMYALVSDAQCVCGGQSFDDFCSDLGYDNDSREAESIFLACRDIWCALIRLGSNLDELSELFQDY